MPRRVRLTRREFLVAGALGASLLAPAAYFGVRELGAGNDGWRKYDFSLVGNGGWRKYGFSPVLGPGLGTCFDVSVLRDGATYRMWFSWRPNGSIALVESADGIHWGAPAVALAPNPATAWEQAVNRPSVVKLAGSYHLWYTGQTNDRSCIGHAVSLDGRSFYRRSEQSVLSPERPWEQVAVMCPSVLYDVASGLFRMWYSAGENYEPNAIGYATSADGVNWTKYAGNPVFAPNSSDAWEKDRVTGCQVVQTDGWHLMFYIGFADRTHAKIGMARSRDGITGWERYAKNPIIQPTPGTWDQDAVFKPYAIFDGKRWLLWYNGRSAAVEQIGLALHDGEDLGF